MINIFFTNIFITLQPLLNNKCWDFQEIPIVLKITQFVKSQNYTDRSSTLVNSKHVIVHDWLWIEKKTFRQWDLLNNKCWDFQKVIIVLKITQTLKSQTFSDRSFT